MEVISLEKSGWNFAQSGLLTPPKWFRTGNTGNRSKSLNPIFHYGFESANRRMTVVCVNEGSRSLRYVLTPVFN